MFKMAFKFQPIEVEGEKKKNKKHCNICEYFPPRREGYSHCSQGNVLFNQGPSLEWFDNNKLRLTVDKSEKG